MKRKVYYGSSKIIDKPKSNGSGEEIDFEKGFYLISMEEQGRRWPIKGTENISTY